MAILRFTITWSYLTRIDHCILSQTISILLSATAVSCLDQDKSTWPIHFKVLASLLWNTITSTMAYGSASFANRRCRYWKTHSHTIRQATFVKIASPNHLVMKPQTNPALPMRRTHHLWWLRHNFDVLCWTCVPDCFPFTVQRVVCLHYTFPTRQYRKNHRT